MRVPSAREILDLRDWGQGLSDARRALALLALALPELPAAALGDFSLGERDRALLALREGLFGWNLEALADCPSCAEPTELSLDTRAVRGDSGGGGSAEREPVRTDGYEVAWRLPTCGDLLALEAEAAGGIDLETACDRLLRRAVVRADRDGRAIAPAELPCPVVNQVRNAIERAAPETTIELELACPACGHRWISLLDVPGFLWHELEGLAGRLLWEVHRLAAAYGWGEAEVLALSSRRRSAYLELIGP